MTKTTERWYNPHLSNLIRYGDTTYGSLRWFIEENLWDTLDDELLKKIAYILDDPKHEYDKDLEMTKKLLGHFIPILKKRLGIDKDHPVSQKITSQQLRIDTNNTVVEEEVSTSTHPLFLDHYIQEQLDMYHSNESMSLLETLSQKKNDTIATDAMVIHSMQTRKTIIGNILSFMLLEDEHKTKAPSKKIIHRFESTSETD